MEVVFTHPLHFSSHHLASPLPLGFQTLNSTKMGFAKVTVDTPVAKYFFQLFRNQLELLLRSVDTDSNLPETISSFDFQYIVIFYFKFYISCSYTLISFTTSSLCPWTQI